MDYESEALKFLEAHNALDEEQAWRSVREFATYLTKNNMYDPNYYSERKSELEGDFNKKVSVGLQKIFNLVGEIQNELNDIQRKFQELEQRKQKAEAEEKEKGEATKKAEQLLKDADKKKPDTK